MKNLMTLAALLAIGGASAYLIAEDVAPAAAVAAADKAAPSEEELLKQISALQVKIDPSRLEDEDYKKDLAEQQKKMMPQRAELAKQFIEAYPDSRRASEMVMTVVTTAMGEGRDFGAGVTAAKAIADKHPKTVAGTEALYACTVLSIQKGDVTFAKGTSMIDEYAAVATDAPGKMRVESARVQLIKVASDLDDAKRKELNEQFIKDHPDSRLTARMKADAKMSEAVGKPFELSFEDAKTGAKVSSETLKGKIVVVDFWATWCKPCVAEMPNMKKLYAEYKDKGVEFVGISLDQPEAAGGKKKLLDYIEENEIAWPQYYQGKGWESEFSKGWGIQGIPTMFLVDHEGKLVTIDARGKLEKLLPEAIEKRDGKK